jgi:glycosyltransferase involved in cell wall biosynthesis
VRITLLCSDLSSNAMSRTLTLAEILDREFEVDVVGSVFGDGIWPPVRDMPWPITAVPGGRWPAYARSRRRLSDVLTGDVVYALKPLPTSLGVALAARRRGVAPVVVDIEDDELSFRPPATLRRPRSLAGAVLQPNSRARTRRVERRTSAADGLTVATTGLQRVYGGLLVPHVRDTVRLAPVPGARDRGRARLGDPPEPVVLFAGTARPFKGIADLAAAVGRTRNPARLVVAGADAADPYVRSLVRDFPGMQVRPPYDREELVALLSAADVVVVPQRRTPQTERQMPAKLLDAMALARPAVATAVSDIPAILADGRGHVVAPGDVQGLADAIDRVLDDPDAAAEMGRRARRWCVEHASYESAQPALRALMEAARASWAEARR